MSPTPNFPKIISVTFTGAAENDPVTIMNQTTGEKITTDHKGNLLRLEGKDKSVLFQPDNFLEGYTVGDIVTFSIGGAKSGTINVTTTAATAAPQESTQAATAVSTAVLSI